jgi:hypothetical protein
VGLLRQNPPARGLHRPLQGRATLQSLHFNTLFNSTPLCC